MTTLVRVAATLVALLAWTPGLRAQQIKAFPQAEGYGENARGGRGGDVYHVTKLNDDGSVGTLRYGIENAPGAGRTIVFDVGGWINLNSKLGVTRDNITIAGQTAPGGGVGVKGHQFSVGADNIIVRHMRFRPGKGAGRVDSISVSSGHDIIFDHISAGFSYDENASANATSRGGVYNLTFQHSAIAYGLEDHSAGSLIQNVNNLSYHHNLYAHNHTRNPKARVEGDGMDWVNNVVYDYNNGFIAGDSDTTDYFWKVNFDGNYYITGPGDGGRPMINSGREHNYGLYFGTNAYDNDGDAQHDGVIYTGEDRRTLTNVVTGTYTWSETRYGTKDVWQSETPQDAYERVLANFGATPWNRDEVDQRTHDNVVNRTGSLITRESDLAGISNGGFGTLAAGSAPNDRDSDGIPDEWENRHGTNPLSPNNNGDFDQDGYTDLEEYLNDIAASKAIGVLDFSGVGRYADWGRWTRQWEPSRLDDVRVATGAAFVDAVGQKAGSLFIGGAPSSNGRLYVTSGWIEVTDNLVVSGAGRVEQHGGETRVLNGGVEVEGGAYRLLGGELSTPSLTISSTADFEFKGGVLATDEIDGDILNQGGRLEIGAAGATMAILNGDLALSAGVLAVELDSASNADALLVSGDIVLGGVLDVTTLGSYVPANGARWAILGGASLTGAFESVTPGFSIEEIDNVLWLVAGPGASQSVPEPTGVVLLLGAATLLLAARRRPTAACGLAAALTLSLTAPTQAVTIATIADTQLSENGTTGLGDATDSGSGTGSSLNARWNYASTPSNRNEWIALKFDLSAYADKSRLNNVSLRPTMFRGNANNSQTLRLYALTPGTAGEDWNESTITYGAMPGFTFDSFSTTNLLNVGGPLVDLGNFGYSGYTGEGNVGFINPASLTSLVQSMGDNDLLTLLVSYGASANGQWRIASREATATETSALTGPAGTFAARLDFDVTYGGVLGDYNDDGVVDAADYTVWRDSGSAPLPNEEVSPGVNDIADYLYWAERYGATDTGLPATAVPEPATLLMIAAVAAGNLSRRR
ncbi:PEP-CTERM sorting domain-containing protein [Botrimarina mediterranea]|uniref:PEP-CTERM sorting domain-containing protein n=1 Tax=Botrimarina mediterranea TaxID=2528022 RepID=UPI00118B68BA|nr:hypothetical protein K2D_13420 [Planctomycetes bacterium K2D]